jgi:heme-degrading monooxygenase HmoA
MGGVYVSMSRLRIAPERAAELVAAFRARLGAVDGHDGFVDLQVWQSDRDSGELIMVSRWRDRRSFTAYMKSADHRRSHDRIAPELDAAIRLERLEHLHTYEVVAE